MGGSSLYAYPYSYPYPYPFSNIRPIPVFPISISISIPASIEVDLACFKWVGFFCMPYAQTLIVSFPLSLSKEDFHLIKIAN